MHPSVYNEGMGASKGCDKNHWVQRETEEPDPDLTTKKKKHPQGGPVGKQLYGIGGWVAVSFACIPPMKRLHLAPVAWLLSL